MKSNEIQNSKTTEKIYQTKSLFFAINTLGKSLARLIREEKKETRHITSIRNEIGDITTDSTAKEIK